MKEIKAYKNVKLEFDEQKHQLLVNGMKNPWNVTGITSVVDKSAGLMGWQEKITREYLLERMMDIREKDILDATSLHRTKKKEAGGIGDQIHEFAELWSLGLKPPMPEEEKAHNGALAFLKWLDDEKIKISHPEEIVYSKKFQFWGIADAEGSRKGKNFLIDYKTSKAIFPEFRMQTAAYAFGKMEMYKRKFDGVFIVKFGKEDGNFEPLYVPFKEAKKDFDAFLHAFSLKKRLQEIKGVKKMNYEDK